jgi:FeS assembly SUF system protein
VFDWISRKIGGEPADAEGTQSVATKEPEPVAEAPVATAPTANPVAKLDLESRVLEAVRMVYDPEIPVNVYELGLIYDLQVSPDGDVSINMTLTAPSCPEAGYIPGRVETAVRGVEGVKDVKVELVWEPQWTPARMSEAAKLQLGILY